MKKLFLFLIIFIGCQESNEEKDFKKKSLLELISEISLFSKEHTVQKGETLSSILKKLNIPDDKQQKIISSFSEKFNLKYIKENSVYEPFFDADSNICYIVYHENHVDKYVIGIKDSIFTKYEHKTIKLLSKKTHAVIEESLGKTIMKEKLPPSIAVKLEDIYSWTIDFFHLQKNDYFKIIFKEQYIDDTIIIGTEKITAALFYNNKQPNYAFFYKNDSIEGYFDLEGKSLKKQFLKSPLKYSRITSRFSRSRFHPVFHTHKAHLGTDFAAPKGTPIMATADGVISEKSYSIGNGYFIKVRHNSIYSTQYLHMNSFKSNIKVGTKVKQGDIIGFVGSTGYATGPHVCYRFWKNNHQINPINEKNPDTKPLQGLALTDFKEYIVPLKRSLDEIKKI